MVTFNEIPNPNRSPLAAAEFDPIGAPGQETHHALLVGIQLSTATVAALSLQTIAGETEGDGKHGIGSQLAEMCRAYKSRNRRARVTSVGVAEPAAGTAAAGEFAITGPASEDGVAAFYVGGRRVAVAVSNGDTATQIGDNLVTALAADGRLPVTGVNTTGTVAVTAKWKGVNGNDIPLHVSLDDGDELPAGVAVAITDMAGGAGQPDLSAVVAVLEETRYDSIITGFADDTSLDTLEAEVRDRWTAERMLDGHVFAGALGDQAALTTLGDARNAPESTIMGGGESPTPPWIWAAQAAAAEATIDHPGVPRYGLILPDCRPPAPADRFTHAARNLILEDGVSTHRVNAGGEVIIDRLVTTYQEDEFGNPSETWRPLTRRRNAAYLRRDWIARIAAKYGRHMLVDDGTQVDPGVPVVSPSVLKGEALVWFRDKERSGHVEDFEAFKASLIAERPDGDAERLNTVLGPNLSNELVTIATKFAFRV